MNEAWCVRSELEVNAEILHTVIATYSKRAADTRLTRTSTSASVCDRRKPAAGAGVAAGTASGATTRPTPTCIAAGADTFRSRGPPARRAAISSSCGSSPRVEDATTAGLLDARTSAQASAQANALAGAAGMLGLHSESDDDDDDKASCY